MNILPPTVNHADVTQDLQRHDCSTEVQVRVIDKPRSLFESPLENTLIIFLEYFTCAYKYINKSHNNVNESLIFTLH